MIYMKQFTGILILVLTTAILASCFSKNHEIYTGPPPREGPLVDNDAGGYRLSKLPDTLFVEFEIPGEQPCPVKVTLHNLGTRLVRRIIDSVYAPGSYKMVWDKLDSNGVRIRPALYYYQYSICDSVYTQRLDFRYHWE